METFIYGFLGALALVVLLGLGGLVGWKAHKAVVDHTTPTPKKLGINERQKLKEGQEAFRLLQNYSTERAYGMVDTEEKLMAGGGKRD